MNSQFIKDQWRSNEQSSVSTLNQQEQMKQELRLKVQEILQTAQKLSADDCVPAVRRHLLNLQEYCRLAGKTFLFVEKNIWCNQYNLQGDRRDEATLFHGPKEDASVAICITHKGSLLYRNGSPWIIYKDMGDIGMPEGSYRFDEPVILQSLQEKN